MAKLDFSNGAAATAHATTVIGGYAAGKDVAKEDVVSAQLLSIVGQVLPDSAVTLLDNGTIIVAGAGNNEVVAEGQVGLQKIKGQPGRRLASLTEKGSGAVDLGMKALDDVRAVNSASPGPQPEGEVEVELEAAPAASPVASTALAAVAAAQVTAALPPAPAAAATPAAAPAVASAPQAMVGGKPAEVLPPAAPAAKAVAFPTTTGDDDEHWLVNADGTTKVAPVVGLVLAGACLGVIGKVLWDRWQAPAAQQAQPA